MPGTLLFGGLAGPKPVEGVQLVAVGLYCSCGFAFESVMPKDVGEVLRERWSTKHSGPGHEPRERRADDETLDQQFARLLSEHLATL